MHIIVKTYTGTTIDLYLKSARLVSGIMEAIQQKEGILCDQQHLIFEGQQLVPENTISFYKISSGATLHLILKLRGQLSTSNVTSTDKFPIYIKTLTGRTLVIDSYPSWTIARMKTAIQEKEGVPSNQQRLIFGGRQLEDDRTLLNYNIK
jgi:ubiquitin C